MTFTFLDSGSGLKCGLFCVFSIDISIICNLSGRVHVFGIRPKCSYTQVMQNFSAMLCKSVRCSFVHEPWLIPIPQQIGYPVEYISGNFGKRSGIFDMVSIAMQHDTRKHCEHGLEFIHQMFRHKIKLSTKPLEDYESRRINLESSLPHVDLLTGVGTRIRQTRWVWLKNLEPLFAWMQP